MKTAPRRDKAASLGSPYIPVMTINSQGEGNQHRPMEKIWDMRRCMVVCLALILVGCGSAKTQFAAADEPGDGDRARVRVVANALIKAVPNKTCIDWGAPGAGTISSAGLVGSKGYRGRSLGMPGADKYERDAVAEFYVAGGKPYTLVLLTGPESRLRCSVGISFTPVANTDYEATLLLGSGSCTASVRTLSGQPVKTTEAQPCN